MAEEREEFGPAYRQGFRRGVGMVVRGLLLVETDQIDAGALIGALSRYEQQLELWLAEQGTAAADPPTWQPSAAEIGAEQE